MTQPNANLKVLIVEDESIVALDLKRMLSQLGYTVIGAVASGEAAVQLAAHNRPHAVLMDITLRGAWDGIQTAERIRALHDAPIIFLTANSDPATLQRATTTNPFGYLIKPFDERDVRVTLEMALYKHRHDRSLRESQARLNATLRSIGDGVIATDVNGIITLMNPVAEQLTGWTMAEAVGKPLAEVFQIINEETRKQCEHPVEKVLQTTGVVGLANHTLLIAKDGRELSIADSGAPIRDEQGQMLGVVLVFRDVTEERKIEATLQNAAKLEAVGLLAGGIAHDFNNLLSGIFGHIHLAQAAIHSPTEAAEHLTQSLKVFQRAKSLTQQLLTFAKGGAPVKKLSSLSKLVHDTAQFALSGSNVRASLYIDEGLWPCEVDEGQIGQVLDNLIINAMQAMPSGGVLSIQASNLLPADVLPSVLTKGHYVRIALRDQGAGIPKEYLSKIFEPFFTTKHHGSGLGLATAYAIVQKHQGHIVVESEVGQGTTFTIYLPATLKVVGTAPLSQSEPPRGQGRILVMDDEDSIRVVLSRILIRQGYVVDVASNGDDALKLSQKAYVDGRPFDVAILDLTVPGGMGGGEIVAQLLQIDPQVRAIASSGYSDDPIMANPRAYGFRGVIAKPYTPNELGALLREVLQKESA